MSGTFIKHHAAGCPGHPRLEAAGLRWLAEATGAGGVRVAGVLAVGDRSLELERITLAAPAAGAGEALGRALAVTHAAGAPWHGAPPPGWTGLGGIGRAPLPFAPDPGGPGRWGEFYARFRVLPYVRAAIRNGALPAASAAVFQKLAERLEAGDFDSPQPGLAGPVARLHGDLWAGNVLWTAPPWPETDAGGGPGANRGWTGATLIDPAAHGGHAETDLAMLALFGIPQLEQVIDGYRSVSPMAPGWRRRVGLHQIHPLLVHAVLFGPSYGERATQRAREFADGNGAAGARGWRAQRAGSAGPGKSASFGT
ncbi:MAG: fructosamine kinase family protein [Bifidobacteriaceae bacterium]|nr:fructosamine kinase family protein [Bifidobacteriaceae bacterium]